MLSPVSLSRVVGDLDGRMIAGASVGDKFGAAALIDMLRAIDSSKIKGTLTIAFVVEQWFGARGLQRIVNSTQPDQLVYVGRLLSGGAVPGIEGVHRAPRRELGSGVLIGAEQTSGNPVGLAADLKKLADTNQIPIETDYSAGVIPSSFLQKSTFFSKWVHVGIATGWANTPAEAVDTGDLQSWNKSFSYTLKEPSRRRAQMAQMRFPPRPPSSKRRRLPAKCSRRLWIDME